MQSTLLTVLAWTMALSSGLMAGIYLAFSGFIMRAFATLAPADGIAAMNAINETIVKTSFLPLFFGSSIAAALLVVFGFWQWGAPGSSRAIIAGGSYVVGMFIITATANVPLNKRLAEITRDNTEARQIWDRYQISWTRWNTARTIAALSTLVISIDLLQT